VVVPALVRAGAVVLIALALAPQARAADSAPPTRLTEAQAEARFLSDERVSRWLDRYPPEPVTDAELDSDTHRWRVHVWSGKAGEVAKGLVDDATGQVVEAWTGPQVAWQMARGRPGAFGGDTIGALPVWLALSAVFLVGLADLRRPFSLRNLDLLVLLSFGISLAFFNRGEVFRSVPLVYPPLLYLLLRCTWVGFRGRALAAPSSPLPTWLLIAACVFLLGFRVAVNVDTPRSVIDVGYAGVIGASRVLDGTAPYGHMPVEEDLKTCGKPDAEGRTRDRIQTNGRCESSNPRGDTYGPVVYLAYVPAVAALGWSGKWDSLPAAHATAIVLDLLVVGGLLLIGRRFGGTRLAALLALGWVAYPFTAYALMANTNDALMALPLVWGFWLLSSPWARGAAVALAGWGKFGALLLAPLWLTYPNGLRTGSLGRYALAFGAATAAAFSVLLLEPDLAAAAETFWDRTVGFQLGRDSPFSLWGWGQYHARGIPDLGGVQLLLQVCVVGLAVVAAVWPRRKGPLELAALTAAVLIAFQVVLTHWFYLYLPWVLPFVLLAVFLPRSDVEPAG
jgi:hypothetical protein